MNSLADVVASAVTTPLWETHGVRFVVREMGNRVARLESQELITIQDARTLSQVQGSAECSYPAPDWIRDLVCEAAERIGLAGWLSACQIAAHARSIDDTCLEVVAVYRC